METKANGRLPGGPGGEGVAVHWQGRVRQSHCWPHGVHVGKRHGSGGHDESAEMRGARRGVVRGQGQGASETQGCVAGVRTIAIPLPGGSG